MRELTQADQSAIRSVIERQLQAFQRDDALGAFTFATPAIQTQFGTPEHFMLMVRTHYHPIYRPRSVMFEGFTTVQGNLAQKVMLMGQAGDIVMALYLMEKQPAGEWRINGCFLVPLEEPLSG